MIKDEGYQVLSDLIYKGFLLTGINVSGRLLVFKTINNREYQLIKLNAGSDKDKDYIYRFNMNYLIYSLFSLDGENVLLDRERLYRRSFDLFSRMPNVLCSAIFNELMVLRESSLMAVDFIEGFSFTDRSRRIWKFSQGNYPNSVELTGIPGTDRMGLNVYQENWVLINNMLDEEEKYNKDFSRSLFVASASNPKGVRSVRAKFDSNIQLIEKRRKKLAKMGSVKREAWTPEKWSAPVDTAEELVAELNRQMEGKKDRHDLFIDKYMDEIKQRTEEKTKKIEDRLIEIREKRGKDTLPLSVEQRPLSSEEAEKLTSRKINNLMIVNDMVEEKQKSESRIYKKIGAKVLTGRN